MTWRLRARANAARGDRTTNETIVSAIANAQFIDKAFARRRSN